MAEEAGQVRKIGAVARKESLGVLNSYCRSAGFRCLRLLPWLGVAGGAVDDIARRFRARRPNLSRSSRTPHGSYIDRILMMLSSDLYLHESESLSAPQPNVSRLTTTMI